MPVALGAGSLAPQLMAGATEGALSGSALAGGLSWLGPLGIAAGFGIPLVGSLFSDDEEEEAAKEQKKQQQRAMAAQDFDQSMQRLFQNMSTLSQFVASGNQNRANSFQQFMNTRMGGY